MKHCRGCGKFKSAGMETSASPAQLSLLLNDAPEKPRKARAVTAPYVKGSDTSQAAAERVQGHLAAREREVLAWIAAAGDAGCTDNETVAEMVRRGRSANGPRARRIGLTQRGFVEATGKTRDRSQTWRATPAGRVWLVQQADEEE